MTVRRTAALLAVLVAGVAGCSDGSSQNAYQVYDAGLRRALAAPFSVYVDTAAAAPGVPAEVPVFIPEDDDAVDHVAVGPIISFADDHQFNWMYCSPVPAADPSFPDIIRCLRHGDGVLTEEVSGPVDSKVRTRTYTWTTDRGDTSVRVSLGTIRDRATALHRAAAIDARLVRWQPSSDEVRRLDRLLASAG